MNIFWLFLARRREWGHGVLHYNAIDLSLIISITSYIARPGSKAPEKGDPDGDIPPNTPFEKLPDSWVCPACGAPKEMFEKI